MLGVDLDPQVVMSAHKRGLNVRHCSLESLMEENSSFDVITMNHVIEHLHDPIAALRICHRLIKRGSNLA